MRVLCIDAEDTTMIHEGGIYEVIESDYETWVLPAYKLRSPSNWYAQERFIPLSDIDETELIAEREAVGV